MDTTHLPPDFREFIQYINSAGVEYLLVGGYAVGFHGAPRFTADMDVWVGMRGDNAEKLGRALEQFGFRDPEVTSGRFLKPDTVFRIGRPPLQIDVVTEISGCDFAECYARRQTLTRDGVEISIISLDDLKMNKRAAGRGKDLGDLEGLA
jgi:phage replication-related protein YjqB (UPF0714/DUF867 family)